MRYVIHGIYYKTKFVMGVFSSLKQAKTIFDNLKEQLKNSSKYLVQYEKIILSKYPENKLLHYSSNEYMIEEYSC